MQTSQMIFYFEDPIAFLNTQLRERQKRNPKFSLRAWARQMGYQNPSLLFQVLKGERRLKMDLANKLAANLKLKGKALRYFELIVLNRMSESETERRVFETMLVKLRPKKLQNLGNISLEVFTAAADWYHWAIYAMTDLTDFQPDIPWIQNRLGGEVDKKSIKEAIDRLIHLGILVSTEDGKFKRAEAEGTTFLAQHEIPSAAVRQYHAQMIDKARNAVEEQTRQERLLMGATLAIDPVDLPKAQEILNEAFQQIHELAEESGSEEIYQFNAQVFRLTKKKAERSH